MVREKEEQRSTVAQHTDPHDSDGELSRRIHELQSVLSTTLAIMRAGYIYLDREGRVTDMNEMAQTATGWTLAEANGVSIWEVFQREDRPDEFLVRNPLDLVLEESWQLEEGRTMVLVSRAGKRLRTDVHAAVTRDEHGAVDGMVVVFRDQSQFFESQTTASRYAAIVESSHDAIVGKSLDGRITSWNTAAETLFGYSAAEALGMPVTRLIPLERRQEEAMILERIGRGERIPGLQTERLSKGAAHRRGTDDLTGARRGRSHRRCCQDRARHQRRTRVRARQGACRSAGASEPRGA
ncbi:PAS domain-containing protein [Roseateles chitinivorans]|uniref:PAS domain-containing protein n=1 Tax=Roseateles chitinivorans TaxID=2917965 RepID=UPI003D67034F